MGSGNLFVDASGQTNPVQSTGEQTLSTAMKNLTSHVTVVITLSGGTHGSQGTFRMDNFTLNGYTVPQSYSNAAPNLYIHRYNYRYGFNGKENDNEVKGEGNQQDYDMRIYDPRVGRWYSTDNITNSRLSPYQFGKSNPLNNIDPDGNTESHFTKTTTSYTDYRGDVILGTSLNLTIVESSDPISFSVKR